VRVALQVEKRLDEEERRVNVLLHNNSHERLITACEKVFGVFLQGNWHILFLGALKAETPSVQCFCCGEWVHAARHPRPH
jgi:hypothetical protein